MSYIIGMGSTLILYRTENMMRTVKTLTQRTTEWTGTNGRKLGVLVALMETTSDMDGQLLQAQRERNGLRIKIVSLVDGAERGQEGLTVYASERKGVAADVGETIGLNAERLALVKATIAEVKTHPEWVAAQAQADVAHVAAIAHDAEHARILRAMGE